MEMWNEFKDWLYKSYVEHPVFTIGFGVACFALGGFFL